MGDEQTFALRGVSVAVRAGELVAVAGPSGSGKSTLLACLAGLDEPDGGHVMIAGQRITRRDEATRARLRGRWIGMLLQSGNLLDHLSVAQNIRAAQALAARAPQRRRLSRDQRRDQAGGDDGNRLDGRLLLEDVGLAGRAPARPSTLSGGEAVRAALAVAMANDPPVLLADEPTGEVDQEAEARLLGLLRDRAYRGKAVLVVTHSERVAAAADRVLRMTDGRISDE
ncbi:MAG: ABC transporter ATP-binding protein [Actinobacteria bacterium]|nr:ABC transporter ATP-binding protein [Actinomycetota bacterium]